MSGVPKAIDAAELQRFKPYPAYRHSGFEWLGKIPSHWGVQRLKNFASVQISNVDKTSVEGEHPVRLCNYVDVYYNERITADIDFMTATATPEQIRRFSLRAGDVLITKDSESWTDIAVPAVVAEDLPGVLCGYHLAHIRLKAGASGAFLARAFSAIGLREQFQISANGITRFGLGGDAIRTGLFPIPPELEQRSIAAFLDRETAKIDALVAQKERLIKLLQEQRAALITQAVTKGVIPNAPSKDSGVDWLGSIPAHWQVISVKRLASIKYGLGEPPAETANGLPFIRATNIAAGRILERDLQFVDPNDVPWNRNPALQSGDIIVVRSGAYTGDSAIVPPKYDGAIAGYDMVVRPHRCVGEFLAWALLSRYVLESQIELESLRAAQPHLNAEELGAVLILLPPETEQRAIASFLEGATAKIDILVSKIAEAIGRTHKMRIAIISAAVSGKIDVREEAV